MVKHIVLWTLKEDVDKQAAFEHLTEVFGAFMNKVPGLLSFELHKGFGGYDMCLMSEHQDRDALEVYQNYPAHLDAKKIVHGYRKDRAHCDFELP